MHIVQVNHMFFDGGGREEHVYQISKFLAEKGHKVTIVASDYSPTGQLLYKKKADRITNIKLVALKGYLTKIPPGRIQIPDLIDFLIEYKADIIHAHGMGEQPAEDAFYAAKINKIPFVYTLHFAPYKVYQRLNADHIWKVFQQYQTYNIMRGADKVLAVSPQEKQDIIKYTKYNNNNFDIIPNGFEHQPEKITSTQIKETYAKFGIPTSRKYVVFLGALTNPRKGAYEAIQAFRQAKAIIPELHLIIIGVWDTRLTGVGKPSLITQLLEKLAKANHVTVTGWVDEKDKYALLSGAHVFLSPTYYEAFGIALCEALYNRLPAVATKAGGTSYVVRHGIDGFLIDDYQAIDKFAQKIIYLIKNPKKAKEMGQAGRERVRKLFSWEKTGEKLEKLYQKLIEKNRLSL